jgi:hypothetical protein
MFEWNEIVLVTRKKFEAGRELTVSEMRGLDDLIATCIIDDQVTESGVIVTDFYAYEFHPRPDSYLADAFDDDPYYLCRDLEEIEGDFRKGGDDTYCYIVYEMTSDDYEEAEPMWSYMGVLDTESLALVS